MDWEIICLSITISHYSWGKVNFYGFNIDTEQPGSRKAQSVYWRSYWLDDRGWISGRGGEFSLRHLSSLSIIAYASRVILWKSLASSPFSVVCVLWTHATVEVDSWPISAQSLRQTDASVPRDRPLHALIKIRDADPTRHESTGSTHPWPCWLCTSPLKSWVYFVAHFHSAQWSLLCGSHTLQGFKVVSVRVCSGTFHLLILCWQNIRWLFGYFTTQFQFLRI